MPKSLLLIAGFILCSVSAYADSTQVYCYGRLKGGAVIKALLEVDATHKNEPKAASSLGIVRLAPGEDVSSPLAGRPLGSFAQDKINITSFAADAVLIEATQGKSEFDVSYHTKFISMRIKLNSKLVFAGDHIVCSDGFSND